MLLKEIKNKKTIEITNEVLNKFNISTSEVNLDEVSINPDNKTLNFNGLEPVNKLYIYDKKLDKLAFNVNIGNSNDATEIINQMISYIENYYDEKGYTGIVITSLIIQLDGSYHTEPNSVIFIKNNLLSRNIDSVVYLPDNKIIAVSEDEEEFIFNREDFISSGIYFI